MDFWKEVKRITEAHAATIGIAVPASLRKPTEGDCEYCGKVTDEHCHGRWRHDACQEDAERDYAEGCRLDSPLHAYARGNKLIFP